MSHFSVLVVTKDHPTIEVLTKVLQPWHEYECTGVVDEYVVDVDITEEAKTKWEKDTDTVMVDPDGKRYDAYDDQFYREPTEEEKPTIGLGTGARNGFSWHSKDWKDGRGYRAKVHFIPEEWSKQTLPTEKTFGEWASDYYGYELVTSPLDGKSYVLVDAKGDVINVINKTNPNAKWDGWTVGGRYANRIIVKSKPFARFKDYDLSKISLALASDLMDLSGLVDPEIIQKAYRIKMMEYHPDRGGCPELTKALIECYAYIKDYTGKAYPSNKKALLLSNPETNSAQIKNIDFDSMLQNRKDTGIKLWTEMSTSFAEEAVKHGWEKSLSETLVMWHETLKNLKETCSPENPLHKLISDDSHANLLRNLVGSYRYEGIEETTSTLEEFLEQSYYKNPLTAWAYVHEGKWSENGEMGWWGMSSGETMTESEWGAHVYNFVKRLDTEYYLAMVDCHI